MKWGRRAATLVLATGALAVVSSVPARAVRPAVGVPAGVIKHVVVIFQENRSFDETLGDYCITRANKCDGSIGPFTLQDGSTRSLTPSPDIINPDLPHSIQAQQIAVDGGKMDGWSAIPGCAPNGQNLCLTYYAPNQVPSLTKLADRYVVSDRTFSLQNSPSWGGHIAIAAASQDNFDGDIPRSVSGVTAGPGWGCDSNKVDTWIDPATHVASKQPSCVPAAPGTLDPVAYPYGGAFAPTQVQHIPTIFDELDAAAQPWRIYSNVYNWSICPSFADCLYTPQHNNQSIPVNILNDARFGRLPAYTILAPSGPGGTGQHAPGSMIVGDNWIGQVVNAIRSGPQWSSTAIFITYDDCGCFYDHVPPGTNPDGTAQGVRVPMVIVSPYAKVGYVDSQPATFASILRFTEETLGLPSLGVNDANAYDYANSFTFGAKPRTDQFALPQHKVPASSLEFIKHHPEILKPDDDT
jgi:phospholipase C